MKPLSQYENYPSEVSIRWNKRLGLNESGHKNYESGLLTFWYATTVYIKWSSLEIEITVYIEKVSDNLFKIATIVKEYVASIIW